MNGQRTKTTYLEELAGTGILSALQRQATDSVTNLSKAKIFADAFNNEAAPVLKRAGLNLTAVFRESGNECWIYKRGFLSGKTFVTIVKDYDVDDGYDHIASRILKKLTLEDREKIRDLLSGPSGPV